MDIPSLAVAVPLACLAFAIFARASLTLSTVVVMRVIAWRLGLGLGLRNHTEAF